MSICKFRSNSCRKARCANPARICHDLVAPVKDAKAVSPHPSPAVGNSQFHDRAGAHALMCFRYTRLTNAVVAAATAVVSSRVRMHDAARSPPPGRRAEIN